MQNQLNPIAAPIPYILPLDAVNRSSLAQAGGKGANLGELIEAGLPVPPGFIVAAAAYSAHLAAAGLPQRIAARLDGLAIDDVDAVNAASQDIMVWIAAAPITDTVRAAVLKAYAALGQQAGVDGAEPAVAVRSSATAEDLPSASFAGQQETYLNIRGADAVLHALRNCWASLWTPQAIAYRSSMTFDHMQVALAVVIQVMVPAEVSGVMFTANPVSGAHDEILISASWGLGEAVVSGAVTPDTFVLAGDGAVKQRSLGAKEIMVLPNGAGTRTQPVDGPDRTRYSLRDTDLQQLAALARRVQTHYGAPQDTEWALSRGRLYLLQARPITTLNGHTGVAGAADAADVALDPAETPINGRLFGVDNLKEYWGEPAAPLDVSFFCASSAGSDELYRLFGMRPAATPPQPAERSDGRVRGARIRIPSCRRRSCGALGQPCCLHPKLWMPAGNAWLPKSRPPWSAGRPQRRQRWPATNRQLTFRAWSSRRCMSLATCWAAAFDAVFFQGIRYSLQLKLWIRLAGLRTDASGLEDGLMRSTPFRTTLQNQAVARLAQLAVTAGKDSPEFEGAFTQFMAEWGSRPSLGFASRLSTPTWREDQGQVLSLVDALATDPAAATPEAIWQEEDASYHTAVARMEHALWPALRGRFRRSLAGARTGVVIREESLYRLETLIARVRQTVLRLGDRLAHDGRLADAQDVFFLLATELAPVASGQVDPHAAIVRRKAAFAQVTAAHKHGRHWLVSTGSIAPPKPKRRKTQPADGRTVVGLAASSGTVEGRVCIVRSAAEFAKLHKGDILVAPATAPPWTPLFRLAAAVVTDIGSPVSHAAIVAHEYGLPAVVATGSGTTQLKDGQLVRVDGAQGTVTILEGA